MTAIYTKGDFTSARVVDFDVGYPLSNKGDQITKKYSLVCVVAADSYSTIANLTTMGSAANAGVIELPITDSKALFVGDSAPASVSGGNVQFVRTFAYIPRSRSENSTGIYTEPPAFATRTETTLYSTGTGNPLRRRRYEYITTPSRSFVIPVRMDYSYGPNVGQVFTEESFDILKTEESETITPISGSSERTLTVNEGSNIITITGDPNVIVGTETRRWMGDIYETVTGYRI